MADSQELFDCSICLGLLRDPVTTTCGHSYCMDCLNTFWDRNKKRGKYSCPQCRQTFNQRPVLQKNTLLAALLEEHRRTTSQSATDDTCAAPGDVQCDICTGKKRKASMFCLVCLVSYCETHLKPHFEVPPLKKHNLTQASVRIKDNICCQHDKLLEIYCRTDQQFICLLCLIGEHKGHDTVAVEAERCQMQKQLDRTKQEIAERLLNSERKVAELRWASDSVRPKNQSEKMSQWGLIGDLHHLDITLRLLGNQWRHKSGINPLIQLLDAAWEVCDDFERLCAAHIRFIQRKCSEMREKVGEAEKVGVDWTNSRLRQLQHDMLELRRREDKLNQLSQTADPIQFFQGFWALGDLPASTDSCESPARLKEFVTTQKDKLKKLCDKEKNELFRYSGEIMLSQVPTPKTTSRTYLLSLTQYSRLEVDPNTVAACLCLSDRNREISWSDRDQAHPSHPDRFTYYNQALCQKGFEGNHYWEVEWDGGIVDLAVSYKGIKRKGSGKDCCFGHNNLSWKLTCTSSGCTFWHNNLHKGRIPPVCSRRVGVHLDVRAGTLGFYSVSGPDTFTLLHQIQTNFSEPLYPGFSVDLGSTLKICST